MIGKVHVRELTPDEIANQCDAWREFCLFMEATDEGGPEEVVKKFRELRDRFGGPGHPPVGSKGE